MAAQTPSLSDSIARRFDALRRATSSAAERDAERARSRADVGHFVRTWCWTYDPRLPVATLPLDPFPRQFQFLAWLAERERRQENGLVEKSRDMGATWFAVAYAVHGWLFRPGFSCAFGSRKLELVDELGDPDSILEKARIVLDMLPGFLLPRGYRRDRHAMRCRILNPQTGSLISGEGGNNIGRGGRCAAYFVDEAAHLERPDLVDRALSATTNVRIDISTPRGVGNPFWRKRFSGAVPVFTMHWRHDPRKGEEWYRKQCLLHDRVTVAQEIDIDYAASVEGVIIPSAWVQAAVDLYLEEGDSPPCAGLDVAAFGRDSCVFAWRRGPVVRPLITFDKANTTQTARKAVRYGREKNLAWLYYDVDGLGEGVRGELDSTEEKVSFRAVPVNGGSAPTSARIPGVGLASEVFLNRRAQIWWNLRLRFERTYERVARGEPHPDSACISIPNDPELIAQLSMPEARYTEGGKVKVESKKEMKARGLKSPDRADALALAFHPASGPPKGGWKLEVY